MGKRSSWIGFIRLMISRLQSGSILEYGYHLTYDLLLSFFPFLIFLITLIGYVNLDSSVILSSMEAYLPHEVYRLVSDIIIEIVDRQRDGLMSFSLLLAIYASSGGFRSFMEASNRAMGIKETRNIISRFLISLLCVLLFALAIVLGLLGIVFGRQIISLLSSYPIFAPLSGLLQEIRFIVPEIFIFFSILTFYMFAPAKRVCFKCAIPGAVVSVLIWTVFTLVFQFYINNYANYSKFYGTLATLIILLVWLLLTSMILLFGVEINALLMERRKKPGH